MESKNVNVSVTFNGSEEEISKFLATLPETITAKTHKKRGRSKKVVETAA